MLLLYLSFLSLNQWFSNIWGVWGKSHVLVVDLQEQQISIFFINKHVKRHLVSPLVEVTTHKTNKRFISTELLVVREITSNKYWFWNLGSTGIDDVFIRYQVTICGYMEESMETNSNICRRRLLLVNQIWILFTIIG